MNLNELKKGLTASESNDDTNVEAIISNKKHFINSIITDVDKVTFVVNRSNFKQFHPEALLKTLNNTVTPSSAECFIQVNGTNDQKQITSIFSTKNFVELATE